jgi:hypothetical protein
MKVGLLWSYTLKEQYRKHRFYLSWVNHGFHNNTTPKTMKPQLQYHGRTIDFLKNN